MPIRPATIEDAAAIAPLLAALGYPSEQAALRERLTRILGSDQTGVLVAESERSPAALVAYQLIDHLERPRPTCRITALVTSADRRRRGAASSLLLAVEKLARERGCDRLEVTTRPDRADAFAFYRRAGFEERPRRLVRPLA